MLTENPQPKFGKEWIGFLAVVLSAIIGGLFLLANTVIDNDPPNAVAATIPSLRRLDAGEQLLFVTSQDGNEEIYILSTEGQKRLTIDPSRDRHPEWSPDGNKIVFVSNRTGFNHIYFMNADGTQVTPLTVNIGIPGEAFCPSWSPDGQFLVFNGNDLSGSQDLYRLDTLTMTWENISQTENVEEWCPRYSPDGRRLVFQKSEGGLEPEIYVMELVYNNSSWRLTSGSSAVWSPDGTRIAFQTLRDGNAEIYVINLDRTSEKNLTNHEGDDKWPVWSPNTDMIAFTSDRNGADDIYTVPISGDQLNVARLTEGQFLESPHDWKR